MTTEILTAIRRASFDILARREHSIKELSQKLINKNFDPTNIQIIIDELIAKNFVSEIRFIENYISARQKKYFGPLHIRAELSNRGISSEQLDKYILANDQAWFELARTAWIKRFKNKPAKNFKERAQQMRFLFSRGFTNEQIQSVISSTDFLE